jgi:hypothetical protein
MEIFRLVELGSGTLIEKIWRRRRRRRRSGNLPPSLSNNLGPVPCLCLGLGLDTRV